MVEPLERRSLLSGYVITDLGSFSSGFSKAWGINDKGQVVGVSAVDPSRNHAFLYDGAMHDLGTLGGPSSVAFSINNSGQIVGIAEISGATTFSGQHAFSTSPGGLVDLGTLGGPTSGAFDVNSAGTIAGYGDDASDTSRAVVIAGGNAVDLSTRLPGTPSFATSVNDAGQVVGYYKDLGGVSHPFLVNPNGSLVTLANVAAEAQMINNKGHVVGRVTVANGDTHAYYDDGTIHDLGTLGGSYSQADAVNDSNVVVGGAFNPADFSHAFVTQNGVMTDLNTLLPTNSGWTLEEATGINTVGQIVGFGSHNGGIEHAFLMTPITLAGTAKSISAAEGGVFSGVVASFTDPNPQAPANYSVTITWGDGQMSTGTVAANAGGGFDVSGTHTYSEEGGFPLDVQIQSNVSGSLTLHGTATVADAPLNLTVESISPVAGFALSGTTVATFTDTGGAEPGANYTATIDWGDGSTTTGTVSLVSGNSFKVTGNHTYAAAASGLTLKVTVVDEGGANASGSTSISVLPPGLTWTGNGDDVSWSDPNNWSAGRVPDANDNVTINDARNPTIRVTGSQAAKTLNSANAISVSNGALHVGTAQTSAPLMLGTGGIISQSTFSFTGVGKLIATAGQLDTDTINGDALVSGNSSLTVTNGLTLNGTLTLGAAADNSTGGVFFDGTQTFTGNAQVIFAGAGRSDLFNHLAGAKLTIDKNVIIHGTNGELLNSDDTGTVLDAGTVASDVAGGSINAGGKPNGSAIGTFLITGGLSASTGGTLNVGGRWANTGTFSVANATLNLGGSFSTAGVGTFFPANLNGTVNITGALNNAAATLQLDASTGSWQLSGGTITGGTITGSDGQRLILTAQGGRLDGVTLNIDLDATADQAHATVTNGLKLNRTATIGSASSHDTGLSFSGTQTLSSDNAGTVLFNGGLDPYLRLSDPLTTLTLASAITVRGGTTAPGGAFIGYSAAIGGSINVFIVNQGTIRADQPGSAITVDSQSFTNQGTADGTAGILNITPVAAGALSFSGVTIVTGSLTAATVSVTGGQLTLNTTAGVSVPSLSLSAGTVNGAADLTLTGSSTFTGGTVAGTGRLTIAPTGALDVLGPFTSGRTITIAGSVTAGIPSRAAVQSGKVEVHAGDILNAAGIQFVGGGSPSLLLDADNAAPGGVMLSGDVTFVGTGTALIAAGGSGSKKGVVDLGGGTRSFTISRGTAPIDLSVAVPLANGAIRKAGPGILQLTSASTYANGTTLATGLLEADDPAALGTGVITFAGGALALRGAAAAGITNPISASPSNSIALDVGETNLQLPASLLGAGLTVTGTTGSLALTGNLALVHDLVIDNAVPVTFGGAISGSFKLTKTGAGALTLTGATGNTFTGTTEVVAGTLVLNKSSGVAIPGPLLIDGPGAVRLDFSGQLAPTSVVSFDATAGTPVLDLNGKTQALAGLAVAGSADLNTFNGSIHLGIGGSLTLASTPTFLAKALSQGRVNVKDSGVPVGFAVGFYRSGGGAVLKYALSGDSNNDGKVTFADLLTVAQHYNGAATSWTDGDFNDDGKVGFADLLALAQNYNRSAGAGLLSPAPTRRHK